MSRSRSSAPTWRYFLFGGEFPGTTSSPGCSSSTCCWSPASSWLLITAHLIILWHQKHTHFPGPGRTEQNVVGAPHLPVFLAKTGGFFFFVFGVLRCLGGFAQINPVWLYGPYNAVAMSAGSQPDWYIGFLEGSLRMMPHWETDVWGHTFSCNVFLPASVPPGIIFTGAALWPFIEAWITGDKREHHLLDRPRNAPDRARPSGSPDRVLRRAVARRRQRPPRRALPHRAVHHDPFRAGRRCSSLPLDCVHGDQTALPGPATQGPSPAGHGVETGIIRRLPSGEFIEVTRPVSEDAHAVLASRTPPPSRPALEPADDNGIPAPGSRGALGKVRGRLNTILTEGAELPGSNGHPNGHGDGNGHGGPGGGQDQPAHATVQAGTTQSDGSLESGGAESSPAAAAPAMAPVTTSLISRRAQQQARSGQSGWPAPGHSGSGISSPRSPSQLLRLATSWTGRRGATAHRPVGYPNETQQAIVQPLSSGTARMLITSVPW